VDDDDRQTIARIRHLMDGNGVPPLTTRLDRLESGYERQAEAIARLERYAEESQRNTSELLGGWKVARWFLIVFTPAIIVFSWWVASKLQAIS